MGRQRRFTRELLEPAVKSSTSFAEVMRKVGVLKWSGGLQNLIVKRISEYDLDVSHFTGMASNSGPRHRGGPDKTPWQQILVRRDGWVRQKAHLLRRALIESGVKYECASCRNDGTWRGKPIRLQVNHKNGDCLDDRGENLEFLCPNCHSQTDGWSGSEGLSDLTSVAAQGRRSRQRRKVQGPVVEQGDTLA